MHINAHREMDDEVNIRSPIHLYLLTDTWILYICMNIYVYVRRPDVAGCVDCISSVVERSNRKPSMPKVESNTWVIKRETDTDPYILYFTATVKKKKIFVHLI